MPDREVLKELIDRVERASGPDREIDKAIAIFVEWTATGKEPPETGTPDYWYSDAFGMPAYTASIDAALSLVERFRPGWHWYVDDRTAAVWPEGVYDESDVAAATPALSIILALLKSLTSGDSNDRHRTARAFELSVLRGRGAIPAQSVSRGLLRRLRFCWTSTWDTC